MLRATVSLRLGWCAYLNGGSEVEGTLNFLTVPKNSVVMPVIVLNLFLCILPSAILRRLLVFGSASWPIRRSHLESDTLATAGKSNRLLRTVTHT